MRFLVSRFVAVAACCAALGAQVPPIAPVSGGPAGPPTRASAPSPARASTPSQVPTDAETQRVVARAREAEERGDLASARAAWNEAARMFPSGPSADDCIGRGRALEIRSMLRTEIAQAARVDSGTWDELHMSSIDELGVEIDGRRVTWSEVPIELMTRATARARPSQLARIGLVFETLARGSPSERDAALADLARLLDKKQIDPFDAFCAVARTKGELPPRGGYVFREGRWVGARELARAAGDAALEDLAKRFENAPPPQRDHLRDALAKLGEAAAARYARALQVRWTNAVEALQRGNLLADLDAVAKLRADLDAKRKTALDLVFDEARYFYPYEPPACPAEKAKLYAAVQHEVDARVGAVRDLWKSGKRAELGPSARAALEEIAWNRARQSEQKLAFDLPSAVPAWIEGIEPALEAVDVRTFAWNAAERAELAEDRATTQANRRNFASKEWDSLRAPSSEERAQVEITNEYRAMLGRRVLAWNPKLEAAAQRHADYMSTSGELGHFEPDPARHAPEDRMRLEGYAAPGGENCCTSNGGAEGAHAGWVQSSGHHRNILAPAHREMASAVSGSCWTQEFGDASEMRAAR
jgi:uncharacterized protein YkwD